MDRNYFNIIISIIQKNVNILIAEKINVICKRIPDPYIWGSNYIYKTFNLFSVQRLCSFNTTQT